MKLAPGAQTVEDCGCTKQHWWHLAKHSLSRLHPTSSSHPLCAHTDNGQGCPKFFGPFSSEHSSPHNPKRLKNVWESWKDSTSLSFPASNAWCFLCAEDTPTEVPRSHDSQDNVNPLSVPVAAQLLGPVEAKAVREL